MMGKYLLNIALKWFMKLSRATLGSEILKISVISVFPKVSTNFWIFWVDIFLFFWSSLYLEAPIDAQHVIGELSEIGCEIIADLIRLEELAEVHIWSRIVAEESVFLVGWLMRDMKELSNI